MTLVKVVLITSIPGTGEEPGTSLLCLTSASRLIPVRRSENFLLAPSSPRQGQATLSTSLNTAGSEIRATFGELSIKCSTSGVSPRNLCGGPQGMSFPCPKEHVWAMPTGQV